MPRHQSGGTAVGRVGALQPYTVFSCKSRRYSTMAIFSGELEVLCCPVRTDDEGGSDFCGFEARDRSAPFLST